MTAPSLTSLLIENLRGAVAPFTLAFEKGRKLTIVYGENGTGKSTISDAFDLLGNGHVGSLDKRGIGGTTRSYWPSAGKTHSDVKVALVTSAGTYALSLSKTGVVVDGQQLKPQAAVLRRSQILNLIAAQPAERYQEISKFVDVSGVETSEATLRKLIGDKNRDYETATTRLGANKATIENFRNQSSNPAADADADADAFSWAKAEVQKDQQALDQRKIGIDGLISRWDKIALYPTKWNELFGQKKVADDALSNARATLEAITSETADDYLEVLDILKAAQQHFLNHTHPTVCPLCESGEKAEGLVSEVNRRIESQGLHAKLAAARKSVGDHEAAAQKESQRLDDFLKTAENDFSSFNSCCESGKELATLSLPAFPAPSGLEKCADWINENQDNRASWQQAADACIDSKRFVETLRRSLTDYEESNAAARDLAAVLPRLREILTVVESERKKYTDVILAEISTRVSELYEAIHCGEGLQKIVLALDAAKRGSLDIAIDFAGQQDAPPQAYFSDSHLDTLGLCVFLALAEREAPEQKILVLDDVLGSVDEPHVERVIGLIYDISQKFQHAIVTTHYRPWREKFRWGILKPDQICQFVELTHWSLSGGMALTGSTPEIARLKALLAADDPDVQAITGKAGVILEAILDFLTLKYGCAVPRKPGNTYVLNDFLSAVHGPLLTAMRAELVDVNSIGVETITSVFFKKILDDIKAIAQARNVLGAHFNALAFDLYPDDGIRFSRLVEQLADALICPDHGWPTKDTGSHWKNGGNTRRLHPLKKPG
jgi:hypothetical protein